MTVVVTAYDLAWPRRFDDERAALETVPASWLTGECTTSDRRPSPAWRRNPCWTSWPASAGSTRRVPPCRRWPAAAPSTRRTGPIHRFHRDTNGTRIHQLHLTVPGSALWRERLAFRDALRAEAALAAEDAALKQRLAARHDDLGA